MSELRIDNWYQAANQGVVRHMYMHTYFIHENKTSQDDILQTDTVL